MRAYLLGLLSTDEASALEEEYFVNRAVFLKIQSEETALIADYLDGNLQSKEKQSFEQRYLEVPALRSKVEAARREHGAARQNVRPGFSLAWRLGAAAALVTVVLLGIWIYQARFKNQQNSATQIQRKSPPQIQPAVENAVATIYLFPSITKGPGSLSKEFQQPAAGSILNLVLDLPGHSAPTERTVQILNVRSDDSFRQVWSSDKLMTSVSAREIGSDGTLHDGRQTGQKLKLTLPASLFQPGDYIVQIRTANNEIQERYFYRVLPPQSSDQK